MYSCAVRLSAATAAPRCCVRVAIRVDLPAGENNTSPQQPLLYHGIRAEALPSAERARSKRKAVRIACLSPMIVTNHSIGDEPTSTVIPSSSRAFRSFWSSFFILRSATLAVMVGGRRATDPLQASLSTPPVRSVREQPGGRLGPSR